MHLFPKLWASSAFSAKSHELQEASPSLPMVENLVNETEQATSIEPISYKLPKIEIFEKKSVLCCLSLNCGW